MGKNHGLNLVAIFIIAAMTLGGLGNAAAKYDGIYWVPFIVNAIIAIVLGIREWRKIGKEG